MSTARHQNSFDFVRFVAATGVIFSHAFPLSRGRGAAEPLSGVTHGQTNLGHLCVTIFFIMSGYLVTQSFVRQKSAARFAFARFLRIWPGLLVNVLFVALVLGSIMTTLPIREYLGSDDVLHFIRSTLTFSSDSPTLPGVFLNSPFGTTPNGSLWSLRYEVICYLLVLCFGVTRLLGATSVALLAVLCAVFAQMPAHLIGHWAYQHRMYLEMTSYFAGGMMYAMLEGKLPRRAWWLFGCAIIVLLSATVGFGLTAALALPGSWLLLALTTRDSPVARWGERGDLSYGIYVYAFPVQQTLASIFHWPWWANALCALPAVLVLAKLSWVFVEAPALRLKQSTLGRAAPLHQQSPSTN